MQPIIGNNNRDEKRYLTIAFLLNDRTFMQFDDRLLSYSSHHFFFTIAGPYTA